MYSNRTLARTLAHDAIARGIPLEWFESLYRRAEHDPSVIPWADMTVNPNLRVSLDREGIKGERRRALVVGCGLGDDAEMLSTRGFRVTAFDISESCIAWCRRRFPESAVNYCQADLLSAPHAWSLSFDFVFEAYTLQVIPADLRVAAAKQVAKFVADGGSLLAIARGRDPEDDPGNMPWPLVIHEFESFIATGLTLINVEDFLDGENPPVRRFRAEYRRPV